MFLWSWYIDPLYLWIFVITLVISIATQAYLRSTYATWSRAKNSAGLNGIQVGKQIIQKTRLGVVSAQTSTPVETPELKKLAELRDEGILTNEEFNAKKAQIQQKQKDIMVSRIKLARSCNVIALAKSEGKLHMAGKPVQVVMGGCGAD